MITKSSKSASSENCCWSIAWLPIGMSLKKLKILRSLANTHLKNLTMTQSWLKLSYPIPYPAQIFFVRSTPILYLQCTVENLTYRFPWCGRVHLVIDNITICCFMLGSLLLWFDWPSSYFSELFWRCFWRRFVRAVWQLRLQQKERKKIADR